MPQTRASEPMRAWSHVKILNRDLRSTVIFIRKPKGIGQTFRLRGRHCIMVMYGDGENGGGSVYERSGPRQVIISAESSLNPKLYPHTKKLIGTDRKPLFVRPLVLSAARVMLVMLDT